MDDQDQQHHHDHGHDHEHDHQHPTRRDVLKGIGVAGAAAAAIPFLSPESAEALQQIRSGAAGSKFLFFTRAQHATVDVLSERLIPADDHSPGASAAKVADYIDLYVGESQPDVKAAWTEGLTALEQASQEKFKVPFVKASAEQQVALLTEMSRGETDPKTPLERFFVESKARTIQGYYTSKIGIHQELGYKGNQFLPEFVGFAEQS
jgi:hypothetical protein